MSRCVIVGAGDVILSDLPEKLPDDLWIAADGGIKHLQAANIKPDLFLGDLDSARFAPGGVDSVILPVRKDDTDTAAAVKAGFDRGYAEFLILGGMGGKRLSHTVANLQLLSYIRKRGGRGTLKSGSASATVIKAGEIVELAERKGYFSLFAATDKAEASISGAKFSGDNIVLSRDFPMGVSNGTDGNTVIKVKSGEIFLITD